MPPTSGHAVLNGFDVRTEMGRIRESLGICPQHDVLWPDLTVREHLQLYAAIKGYKGAEMTQVGPAHFSNTPTPAQRRCSPCLQHASCLLPAALDRLCQGGRTGGRECMHTPACPKLACSARPGLMTHTSRNPGWS